MATPTAEIIDLSWVEFSEEQGQACTTRSSDSPDGCSRQAIWKAWIYTECDHHPKIHYYCDHHLRYQVSFGLVRTCRLTRGGVRDCPARFGVERWQPIGKV